MLFHFVRFNVPVETFPWALQWGHGLVLLQLFFLLLFQDVGIVTVRKQPGKIMCMCIHIYLSIKLCVFICVCINK